MEERSESDDLMDDIEEILASGEDSEPETTREVHDLDEGVQTFEAFPDHTDAVLATLAYSEEAVEDDSSGEIQTELSRTDIQYTLPPEIDLSKDQIKYRAEKLVGERLVEVDWRTNRDNGRPTAYYEITELGRDLLANHEYVKERFGESPEQATREDIYDLVALVRESHRRLDDIEDRLEELEEPGY